MNIWMERRDSKERFDEMNKNDQWREKIDRRNSQND